MYENILKLILQKVIFQHTEYFAMIFHYKYSKLTFTCVHHHKML
jgi:hypothetical protein